MNPFDRSIALFLNQFVRGSWAFDQAIAFLSVNHLLKGGVLMMIFWGAWFWRAELRSGAREHLMATVLSSILALAIARLLILMLPFRPRPLYEASLGLTRPYGVAERALDGLSSFPSDHAVLFFCLATGFFFVSRTVGWLALIYTAVFIALPRLYLGLHYASDILVGGLLGAAVCVAGNLLLPHRRSMHWLNEHSHATPWIFYPCLFLVTYQISDLFENSRNLIGGAFKLVGQVIG